MELQILPLLPSSQVLLGQMIHWTICYPKANHLGSYIFLSKVCGIKYQTLQKGLQDTWGTTVSIDCLFFWNQPFGPLPIRLKKHLPKRNLREKHRIELGKNWVAVFCWETNGQWWCYKKEVYNSISICFCLQRLNDVTGKGPFGQGFLSTQKKRHCYSLVNRYCLHGSPKGHQWWTSHSGWYHPANQDGTVSCDELLRFLVRNSNQNRGNTRVLPNPPPPRNKP